MIDAGFLNVHAQSNVNPIPQGSYILPNNNLRNNRGDIGNLASNSSGYWCKAFDDTEGDGFPNWKECSMVNTFVLPNPIPASGFIPNSSYTNRCGTSGIRVRSQPCTVAGGCVSSHYGDLLLQYGEGGGLSDNYNSLCVTMTCP